MTTLRLILFAALVAVSSIFDTLAVTAPNTARDIGIVYSVGLVTILAALKASTRGHHG